MKFVLALLVIILVATGYAAQVKSQAQAAASEAATRQAIASLKRVSTTKLGKTLLDTLQIELKASTGTDPRPRILQLLREIQDETNDQIQGYNDRIATVRQDCQVTEDRLEEQISDLEEQIEEANAEQGTVTADLQANTADNDANVELNASLQIQLDEATSQRATEKAEYDNENQRLQKIRSILEQTRGFIDDRLDQRQNPSFLQKNNILVEIKKRVMSTEFQTASAGWGKFINFLATKALEKIRQTPDESAVDALERIVTVINDIIDHVNQSINSRNTLEISAEAAFDATNNQLSDAIRNVATQLAALQLTIQTDKDRLAQLAAQLITNAADLAQAQNDLQDKEATCKESENQYTEDFSRSNEEAEIIQEVIDIIQNQLTNLRSAVESAINSA